MEPCDLQLKIHPEKIFLYSAKIKLSNFNLLGNGNPEKILDIFLKESFSYISGNGNPEKIFYISGNGTFLYFRKTLIFQEVTFRSRKVKITHSEKTSYISTNGTF